MIHIAAFLFAFAGFTAICVSMAKHQIEAMGRKLDIREQNRIRVGGWVGLACAYACTVASGGWKFGTVAWVGTIILAAFILVVTLMPYRPRLAPRAGVAAAVVGVMLAASAALIAIP